MAKKKSSTTPKWAVQAAAASSSYDSLFSEIVDEAKKYYPGAVYSGGEQAGLLICLPVPSLAIRYLFQQEGLPLCRFIMIVGEQECCKSALTYEIIRWHRLQKGFGTVIDTEFKPAPDLMYSILNYDYNACSYEKFKTLDGWCNGLNFLVQNTKTKLDGNGKAAPGPGRVVPFCWSVDSLTAGLDEKEYDRLAEHGTPKKHFADVAGLLTDYIKMITKEIDGYPFSLMGVNHLKPSFTAQGIPIRNIAGGKGLRFHQALELEMKRKSSINPSAKNQIRRLEDGNIVEGIDLQIGVMKNSNAPHEYVGVEMLWYIDFSSQIETVYTDPVTGEHTTRREYPQRTWFDWHATSTELILNILKEKSRQAKILSDVLMIAGGDDRRYCYSPTLGVPEKDKISWRAMGELLEQKIQADLSFRDALYPILGIRRRYMYRPGVDYRQLIEDAKTQGHLADMTEDNNGQ